MYGAWTDPPHAYHMHTATLWRPLAILPRRHPPLARSRPCSEAGLPLLPTHQPFSPPSPPPVQRQTCPAALTTAVSCATRWGCEAGTVQRPLRCCLAPAMLLCVHHTAHASWDGGSSTNE